MITKYYPNKLFANLDAARAVPGANIFPDGIIMSSRDFDKLRRKSLINNVASFLQAMLTAKRVTPDVLGERVIICNRCQYQRGGEKKFCSVSCGCQTTPRESTLLKSLTEVEENLPKWGCKHPERSRGKGWLR